MDALLKGEVPAAAALTPYPTEYPGSVLVEASVLQCVRYCCCLSMLVTPMAWYGYTRTLALSVRGTHYISRYLLRGVGIAFCTGLVGGLAVGCYDTNSKYDKSESGIAAMINDSYLMKIDVENTQWAVTTITFAFVFAVILLLFYEPAAGHNSGETSCCHCESLYVTSRHFASLRVTLG